MVKVQTEQVIYFLYIIYIDPTELNIARLKFVLEERCNVNVRDSKSYILMLMGIVINLTNGA